MCSDKRIKGFTLVELLVAMAIALILMTLIYATYRSQQNAYLIQDQMAAMQQNVRAAMHLIERELLLAGFDPYEEGDVGIEAATNNLITFSYYGNFNGEDDDSDTPEEIDEKDELVKETITYDLYNAYAGPDGLADDLGRDDGSKMPAAMNIETIDFVYLNASGSQLGTDSDGDGLNDTLTAGEIGNIRSIEVTIVGKTNDIEEGWIDRNYTNTNVYQNAQGQTVCPAKNDHLRRMVLTKRVRCRNL